VAKYKQCLFVLTLPTFLTLGLPFISLSDQGHKDGKVKSNDHMEIQKGRMKVRKGHTEMEQEPHNKVQEEHTEGKVEQSERTEIHVEKKETPKHGDGERMDAHEKELSPLVAEGREMVEKFHCIACHFVEPALAHEQQHGGGHGQVAPDLTFEGDKVRPEWLFSFLKGPHTLRPWLQIRMPNFRFSDEEALALTLHIVNDMRDKGMPPLPGKFKYRGRVTEKNLEAAKILLSEDYFDCFKCHQQGDKKPEGLPEEWAPDLAFASQRLNPDWIVRWLKDPQKIQPGARMPNFFSDADSGPENLLDGDEDRQINALRDYLVTSDGKDLLSHEYLEARKKYPGATSIKGWELMAELNCAGCHDMQGMHERKRIAPDLVHEGSKVHQEWLVSFLKRPYSIRPEGHLIGIRGRMPNFRLSEREAKAITAYLMTLVDETVPDEEAVNQDFADTGIENGRILFQKSTCIACHKVKVGQGSTQPGKLRGPDLIQVTRRLKAGFLVNYFSTVESGEAHPFIPYMRLTDQQIKDLVAYVLSL